MTAEPDNRVRADVWTWAVRLYPTRSTAAAAARGGHIKVNGKSIKPAQLLKVGDTVSARIGETERIVVVTALISRRVSAPLARENYEDHTPVVEKSRVTPTARRDPGAGRPTKRDRRQIDRLRGI